MQRVINDNPNTKLYWNSVYTGKDKRDEYERITAGQNGESTRFYRVLDEVTDGDKFVDIGCGIGILTNLVKNTYPECEVWGTDISSQAMQDNTMQRPDIKYLHQYIGDEDELPDNYFDVAFCGETIEHLEDPTLAFKDACRVLKSGGKLIITTPLNNMINSPEHIWSYNHDDIDKLYTDHGFDRPRFVYLPNLEHLYIIFAVGRRSSAQ